MRFSRICGFLSILLLTPLSALAQDNVFTPQHVAKLHIVTEAVIAPDGMQVAYVLSVPRDLTKEKDGPAWAELHVVDTKGNSTPFITGAVNVGNIGWTPDGKSITFLAKRDKDEYRTLYAIGVKGGEARRLLVHKADLQGYSFNGDGSAVVFLATDAPSATKKKLQDQRFNQEIYEEDTPFTHVWLASLIEPETPKLVKLEGSASELHYNPKEDKIAVALAPSPSIDDHIMFRKVHIVDLKTGKATNLNNPGKLGQVAWSPDGKMLAMISGKDKHDPKEGRLLVYGIPKTDGWKDITAYDEGHYESMAWLNASVLYPQSSYRTSTSIAVSTWQLSRRNALI